jgi:hypothetical protein
MTVGILSFLWREDLNASETMKTTDSVDEDHLFWISLLSKTTFIQRWTRKRKNWSSPWWLGGRRLGRKMRMDMNRNRTTAIVT